MTDRFTIWIEATGLTTTPAHSPTSFQHTPMPSEPRQVDNATERSADEHDGHADSRNAPG